MKSGTLLFLSLSAQDFRLMSEMKNLVLVQLFFKYVGDYSNNFCTMLKPIARAVLVATIQPYKNWSAKAESPTPDLQSPGEVNRFQGVLALFKSLTRWILC